MITFHEIILSDVEDPEIYAAQPIWEWEISEQGRWCMENSTIPVAYRIIVDYNNFGYRVDLYGDLKPEDRTYFNLKWGIK